MLWVLGRVSRVFIISVRILLIPRAPAKVIPTDLSTTPTLISPITCEDMQSVFLSPFIAFNVRINQIKVRTIITRTTIKLRIPITTLQTQGGHLLYYGLCFFYWASGVLEMQPQIMQIVEQQALQTK